MTRVLVPVLFAFVLVGFLLTPALAQAPQPKVTITGLFDQVTSGGRNFYDGNLSRDGDREWYARTRFRPDFEFQVGRVKAVLGIEIDLQYGQAGPNDGGFPTNNTGDAGGSANVARGNQDEGCKNNANGCLDLNTDVAGMLEVKWIYTEFPLTGKDSILPFIPVETMARAGGQPWGNLANYKVTYANGDFAGISTVTTFTPNFNLSLAYAVVEDEIAGGNRSLATARTNRGEDWAIIVSPEITPFKGLSMKPLYSYFHADGITSGGARHQVQNRRFVGGNTTNPGSAAGGPNSVATVGGGAPAGDAANQENRQTIGIDARWRSGPFGFDPSLYYQWGKRDSQAVRTNGEVGRVETDMSSWLIDLIGSYQLGPLLLEARAIYTPGNKARDNLAQSVRYYQPLSMDGSYYTGWAAMLGSGVDYFNSSLLTNMPRFIGYDRYGRASLGFRGTYSITPAFSVYSYASPTWTAEKVDIDTGAGPGLATSSFSRFTVDDKSWVEGDSRYIGTEVDLGLVWRFAPNAALELQGAYFFAGKAMWTSEVLNGVHTRKPSEDGYTVATRVRLAF